MFVPSYYISKSGVPILSKESIDYIAERFLEDFCPEALKEPREIDIESFAFNYLKLEQDFQYLSHCGIYLGMMVFKDTDKLAVYNPDKNRAEYIEAREGTIIIDNSLLEESQECRYRFTVGHEAGHWIFHRLFFQRDMKQASSFLRPAQAVVQCRAASLEGKMKHFDQWNDSDRMEWQANYMSSALFMPKSIVVDSYNRCYFREDMERENDCDAPYYREMYTNSMAGFFNVSRQAAEIRLKSLGLMKGYPISQPKF